MSDVHPLERRTRTSTESLDAGYKEVELCLSEKVTHCSCPSLSSFPLFLSPFFFFSLSLSLYLYSHHSFRFPLPPWHPPLSFFLGIVSMAAVFDEQGAREAAAEARLRIQDAGVQYTPADTLFAQRSGHVAEAETPSIFQNAILGDRYRITAYIQSGQFGRGAEQADKLD